MLTDTSKKVKVWSFANKGWNQSGSTQDAIFLILPFESTLTSPKWNIDLSYWIWLVIFLHIVIILCNYWLLSGANWFVRFLILGVTSCLGDLTLCRLEKRDKNLSELLNALTALALESWEVLAIGNFEVCGETKARREIFLGWESQQKSPLCDLVSACLQADSSWCGWALMTLLLGELHTRC